MLLNAIFGIIVLPNYCTRFACAIAQSVCSCNYIQIALIPILKLQVDLFRRFQYQSDYYSETTSRRVSKDVEEAMDKCGVEKILTSLFFVYY